METKQPIIQGEELNQYHKRMKQYFIMENGIKKEISDINTLLEFDFNVNDFEIILKSILKNLQSLLSQ